MKLLHYTLEIKWALLFNLVFLLWMLGEKGAGLHDAHIEWHPILTNLFAIPAIAMYVLALANFKNDLSFNRLSFLQGFLFGLRTTLLITLLSPLMQWIVSEIITPDFFDNAIHYTVQHGMKTQLEAEQYFNLKSYLLMSVIGNLIMGIFVSAMVAAGFSLYRSSKPTSNAKRI